MVINNRKINVNNCSLNSIVGVLSDREVAANNFEHMLLELMEIFLLTVGIDRHFLSLIPGSNVL